MDLDKSIMRDAENIAYSVDTDPYAMQHEVMLHTKQYDFKVTRLVSIETISDFVNNVADYIIVTMLMPMGDYVKDILPYSHNLELTITYNYYGNIRHIRYKALILNNRGGVHGQHYDSMSRDELNQTQDMKLEIQCLDTVTEILRTMTVGGLYKYTKIKDVLVTTFKETVFKTANSNEPRIHPSNRVINEVLLDIDEPDNDIFYRHIEIPFGTKIYDVPSYLQNKNYGVYNGGIGNYLKIINIYNSESEIGDVGYFIYNLYDNTKFNKDIKKLMVININNKKLSNSERSYAIDGNVVKIISSGNSNNSDIGDNDNIDVGTVITKSNQYTFLNEYKNVHNDGIKDEGSNSIEEGSRVKREDGVYNKIYVGNDGNLFKANSEVIKGKYMLVQVNWPYSLPELLTPAMPVSYIYKHEKLGMINLKGRLLSVISIYNKATKATSSMLYMAIEKPFDPSVKLGTEEVVDLNNS